MFSQPAFSCSNLTTETPKQGMRYVQILNNKETKLKTCNCRLGYFKNEESLLVFQPILDQFTCRDVSRTHLNIYD